MPGSTVLETVKMNFRPISLGFTMHPFEYTCFLELKLSEAGGKGSLAGACVGSVGIHGPLVSSLILTFSR